MTLLLPVLVFLLALTISLIVIRVGTMAFMLTGLSRESARFQAHSAFTGVGFTTRSNIVVQTELVGMRPQRQCIDFVSFLVRNPSINHVLGKDISTEQEFVVRSQGIKGLAQ